VREAVAAFSARRRLLLRLRLRIFAGRSRMPKCRQCPLCPSAQKRIFAHQMLWSGCRRGWPRVVIEPATCPFRANLLGTLSDVAIAQTTEQCQSIQRARDLLDCYNGTTRPHTPGKPKTSKASTAPYRPAVSEAPIAVDKPAASKTPTDQRAKYVGVLDAENSKIDAKMKTICQGC
jgi:hypothetical protein